jgi:signal transduction histidine kinase
MSVASCPFVFTATGTSEPWRVSYRARCDESLTTSTIACAAIIPPTVIALSAYMLSLEPATRAVRLGFGSAYVTVCVVIGALWLLGILQRHATLISMAFAMILAAVTAVQWRFMPQAVGGGSSTLLVIQMGAALVFAWGPWCQGILSAWILVAYAWLVSQAPEDFQPYAAGLLVATAPLMVFAAALVDRHRRDAFLRDWQKDQIVSLARDLGMQLDHRHASETTIAHGLRLLDAEASMVMLRIPERGTYRIEALHPPDSPWGSYEISDEFGLFDRIGEVGVFVLPDDDRTHPLLPLLAQEGMAHTLFAAIFQGRELVGVMTFSRRIDVPFCAGDRALGRAIADQTGLALRTASVINDLQRASQLKSEFVSTVSHELRTPLNVILGYAEMALDAGSDAGFRTDCVTKIEAAGRDLLELIESTLEIGKLEAGRQDVQREDIALPKFWEQLANGCKRLPQRPGVALDWSPDVPPITVETDPRKLTIIIRNLVGNALKFTERGHVRVDVLVRDAALGFRVSDSGIGISAQDRESIFEMFRQADGSDARRYGGVGLGLYIVRRFVDQLGGTIELESEPKIGTTFTIWLPCASAVGAAQPIACAARAIA